MKKYSFLIDRSDEYDPDDWERIDLNVGWFPSRKDATDTARWYNFTHEDFGLYVDWIFEYDENDNQTASLPYGDYFWQRWDNVYHWDEP